MIHPKLIEFVRSTRELDSRIFRVTEDEFAYLNSMLSNASGDISDGIPILLVRLDVYQATPPQPSKPAIEQPRPSDGHETE
jgi:hypothetical protein